jgi:hypothetical protein
MRMQTRTSPRASVGGGVDKTHSVIAERSLEIEVYHLWPEEYPLPPEVEEVMLQPFLRVRASATCRHVHVAVHADDMQLLLVMLKEEMLAAQETRLGSQGHGTEVEDWEVFDCARRTWLIRRGAREARKQVPRIDSRGRVHSLDTYARLKREMLTRLREELHA